MPPGRGAALAARLRLVHPFPSLLNGSATLAIALLAGGSLAVAVRLGLAMTALQFSIGALNDVADAARDAGRRPIKPVAEGLVSPTAGRWVAGLFGLAGLALAGASGPATVAVAALGLASGYAYDVRLSRTVWSWAPLAFALPLVPVFAWLGVSGQVASELLALVPLAALAGAGLAIGNSLTDLEGDRAARIPSLADRLGPATAARLHAFALGGAAILALGTAPIGTSISALLLVATGVAGLAIGSTTALLGSRPDRAGVGRLGWQIEAVGVALLGLGWLVAHVATRAAAG